MESAGSTDTPDVSNPFEDISNPSSSLPETGGDTMDVDESDLPPKGETENTNTNITQDDILPTDSENMVLDENPKNTGDEITQEGDGTTKETGTDEDVQDETEEKIDDESADKRSADETAMIEDEENNEKETAEIEDIRESCETNPLEEDKMDVDDRERGMEIAEVSMEELSSEATALEEGADPMPEGEEATRKVETGTDENDIETEPDVAGPDVETITTDISEEKESGSKGKRPEESNASDKYVITHHNSSDDEKCCICLQKCAAKYVANNNKETFYICLNECLSKFKEKHQNNYVEKILRLRAFAIQENLEPEKPEEEFECENDDDKSNSDRKCMHCNVAIIPGMHLSWEAKDFCNEGCLLNYQRTMNSNCGKCSTPIADNVIGKYCVRFGSLITQFCSTACIIAYKKGNSFFCAFCQHEMRARTEFKNFCSKRCMEVCQSQHSGKERGECAVCHNIKQVKIKIKMGDKIENICGEMCCVAYKFVNKIQPIKCNACITQFDPAAGGELVIYLNNKPHTVCSEECQKILLLINRKIISCKMCMIKKYDFDMVKVYDGQPNIKFTCSNACMKVYLDQKFQEFEKNAEVNIKQLESCVKDTDLKYNNQLLSDYLKNSGSDLKTPIHKIVLTVPRPVVKQRNVATMCRPFTLNKETNHKPETNSVEIQTDVAVNKLFIPVPMPIHVPTPVHLFAQNVPFLVPIPLPLPVPIFIPTGRKSLSGIAKEIQKIRNRVPADPLEAEILMMAEKAAGDKKDESSSESETDEAYKAEPTTSKPTTSEQPSNEDVLSLALKMTDNFQETEEAEPSSSEADPTSRIESIMEAKRKNIRQATKTKTRQVELPPETLDLANPDSSLSLKYTFGVNAWKQWVTIKNAELQKTQKRPTLFKTDILQLSADDLNLSLCLFVKEVRKPSGAEYAPDTIYYLCLGIQQYLYENGRIDNIFCDPFYETFTDTFNEVCVKFSNLYNETQYIVTRVEEEHLWESKQLGAHSPLVLLNTLMFFNTKHFSLTNVSEHLQLSFSHIMKHWKRNVNAPGCRSVLLRFYPPISADGKKKKVYEQLENDANPLRCPVKLYEFYLSKCPESVKTRNDVFYLLPERSCVPDSPVWYSTMALDREPLEKMLNRIKMVKEINVALLTA